MPFVRRRNRTRRSGRPPRRSAGQHAAVTADIPAVSVRRARATDVPAVLDLLGQLGYAPEAPWVRTWVCSGVPDDRCLVAEAAGRVVGLAHLHRVPFLTESTYRARLTALVVDEAARSRGVGALLLAAAERTARDMGATALELSTSNRRLRAHRFYERHGYTQPSRHYRKDVPPDGP